MVMIQLNKINKTYYTKLQESVKAAADVSLTIEEGDFLALTGASGSGKSTLLNLIGCLDMPDSGEYRIEDSEVTSMDDEALSLLRAETFGFVFQSFHLLEGLSVEENVALPLVYRPEFQPPRSAMDILESVGLQDRGDHMPNELSGGQKQRVAIARALIGDPKVILADEPIGNLDSKATDEILQILEKLNQSGRTLIMVTHDDEMAARAGRVIRMEDGRIIQDSSKTTLEKKEGDGEPESGSEEKEGAY
jgi:putative ABC transport system ATP-binding protein